MNRQVDVAIIGGGTAGLAAYHQVTKCGASAVLIEGRRFGTTCARVGCMPSKLLIAAAEAVHGAQHLGEFGASLPVPGVAIDGEAVMARVQRERDRFTGFVIKGVEKKIPEDRRMLGMARFIAPGTLEVDGHGKIEANRVVIAIGSEPWVPAPLRAGAGRRLLTTDDVFELPTLPERLLVIGAGVIGLELGQAMHRLGVRTHIVDLAPTLSFMRCPWLQREAQDTLATELNLSLGIRKLRLEETDGGVLASWLESDGTERSERVDHVLAATGRRPSFQRLELSNAGVEVDENGIPEIHPDTLQIGDHPIFVAGDATRDRPLLHEASDEGHIAGQNAGYFPDVRPGRRRTPLTVVFSDPQFAAAGVTGCDLDESLVAVGTVSFAGQGRARVMNVNRGAARIYAELGSGVLLGAEIFGPRAEHMGHLLAWAIEQKLTVQQALQMPFYHPVLEEGLRTALRQLEAQLQRKSERVRMNFDCKPPAS